MRQNRDKVQSGFPQHDHPDPLLAIRDCVDILDLPSRISGNFAAIGPIYIYRYEYEAGSGPMSQQSQPMHNTSLTIFPNPFTENLNITYQTVGQSGADLKIYDVTGRVVRQFMLPTNVSLNHIIWDGVDDHGGIVPQGVYFLRIDNPASGDILCRKVLRVK